MEVMLYSMRLKQLLIVFQKFIQNIHSREQRLVNTWKERHQKKMIFTPLKKEGDRILWTMKCCKKSKMFSSDHV